MKRLISTLCLTVLLAACGSSVKLDDVPVSDAKVTAVGPQTGTPAGGGAAAGERSVTPVNLGEQAGSKAGPANTIKVIYFDYDSFVIKPEFQGAVEAHAKFLAADRNRKISIEGHTDERGGREYNLALGQKRSEAVRRALGLLGVTEAQVEAVSFGKEKPAATGATEEAFARNRRAEISYR